MLFTRSSTGKPRKKTCVLITVSALSLAVCLPALLYTLKPDTAKLTLDGQPKGIIMIPQNASEMEAYAARELQEHVLLVSMAYLPIVRGEPNNPSVYVSLSTANLSVSQLGYCYFEIIATNTTASAVSLILQPSKTAAGEPSLELAESELTLAAGSFAAVGGRVGLDAKTNDGSYTLTVDALSKGGIISSLDLSVDFRAGENGAVPQEPEENPNWAETVHKNLGKGGGTTLFLATPDSYPALSKKYSADLNYLDGSDGFAIRQKRNVIYIFGTEAGGALNGVYDFIEKNLGVLWTRSTELGTLYDPAPTVTAGKVNYREKSPFDIRGWHLCGIGAGGEPHSDPGTEIMMSRNKLNAKFAEFFNLSYWDWQKSIGIEPVNLGHSLHHWLNTSPYYQNLSADKQGACWNTDTLGKPTVGRGHLNFWNPDVAIAIAESVNIFLDDTGTDYVGVGIEDTPDFKQIPEETKPFEYAPGKFVGTMDSKYLSTVFYSFMNDVARRVSAEHPDARLTTFAYLFTETVPYVKLEDNITVVIAPIFEDMKYSVADPASSSNRPIKDRMSEWAQSTKNVFVYNYYGCFPSACEEFERPIAKRIQADLKFYTEQGFKGLLPEGHVDNDSDMWAVGPLTMWLYSKLAWNPDADTEALTRLFCEKAYGGAAGDMFEYYRLLQETWDNNSASVSWNDGISFYAGIFYSDNPHNALMQAALDRAWAAAGDIQKQRIAPIKAAFEKWAKV